jgi:23S rRNA (guanosine2251-2'-O)-methyltransferase
MARKIKSPGARTASRSNPRSANRPAPRSTVRSASPAAPEHDSAAAPQTSNRGAESWLYGRHPVFAALENPDRRIERLLATTEVAKSFPTNLPATTANLRVEIVSRRDLDELLPEGAVHQGCALLAHPSHTLTLEDILDTAGADAVVVLLDQVSDPHNVGAVLRSAAVFGASAVIAPARGAPPATGVLAKAASGALEQIPLLGVANLARAMETLKQHNFWCIGLDGGGDAPLTSALFEGRVALVLGAEGQGLRRLTRKNCDVLATIPSAGPFATLNVSNAAAIALYEVARRRTTPQPTKK